MCCLVVIAAAAAAAGHVPVVCLRSRLLVLCESVLSHCTGGMPAAARLRYACNDPGLLNHSPNSINFTVVSRTNTAGVLCTSVK